MNTFRSRRFDTIASAGDAVVACDQTIVGDIGAQVLAQGGSAADAAIAVAAGLSVAQPMTCGLGKWRPKRRPFLRHIP